MQEMDQTYAGNMKHHHAGHIGHNGDHSAHDMTHIHDMHNMPASDHHPVFNNSLMDNMNNILNKTSNTKATMDHSMHNGLRASEHDHSSHGGMSMTFHGGYLETILFSWWDVKGVGEFIGSFFAIFIVALLYEGLKYYRKHLLWKTYSGLQYCAVAPPDKGVANACATDEAQVIQPLSHLQRNAPTMLSTPHVWQTFLHGVQVLVSYMLMLVFMSYNTWLCLAVVSGSAFGYFLFGWRESVVVDFTEHCH